MPIGYAIQMIQYLLVERWGIHHIRDAQWESWRGGHVEAKKDSDYTLDTYGTDVKVTSILKWDTVGVAVTK